MVKLLSLLIIATYCCQTMANTKLHSDRFKPATQNDKGEWQNNYPIDDHGLSDFLKWQWQTIGNDWQAETLPVIKPAPLTLSNAQQHSQVTWIGHSSFLIQKNGFNILTDPVFSQRCSPVQWAGPKRLTPLPLTIKDLPPIHAVVISHSHYDHLDKNSVSALIEHSNPQFYVPMGLAKWFHQQGTHHVVELNWWQFSQNNGWRFYAVPAQHFSGRSLSDRNHTLWAGWVMQHAGKTIYFAGDTGYSPGFKLIGEFFKRIDLALIPIGAYNPRWFMQPVHIDPEQAVRIHKDVRSVFSIGMHWGTFKLTDEPLSEPPSELRKQLSKQQSTHTQKLSAFITVKHGETTTLNW